MERSTANALAPLDFIVRVATGPMLLVLAFQVLTALRGKHLAQMWADTQLTLSMARTPYAGTSFFFLHVSWAVVFAGFGLLTVGRVIARSVVMQREIDATV